jgi:hypothetical protein
MSRSVQKIPCRCCTDKGRSDSAYKKMWHQCLRSRERMRLSVLSLDDFDAYIPLLKDDVADIYESCKDDYVFFSSKHDIDRASESLSSLYRREKKLSARYRHRILGK